MRAPAQPRRSGGSGPAPTSCSHTRHPPWFSAHRSPGGGLGSHARGALAGALGAFLRPYGGTAPSSQSKRAQQKPHPVRQLVHHPKRESKRKGSLKSEKIVRQLLGELYVDKEYLEKLLLDEGVGHFVCSRELRAKKTWGGCLTHEPKAKPIKRYLLTRSSGQFPLPFSLYR